MGGGGVGGSQKNQYRGGNCLKRGGETWTFCIFKREGVAWQEREGWCF